MIKLHSKLTHLAGPISDLGLLTISRDINLPAPLAKKAALITNSPRDVPDYFKCVFIEGDAAENNSSIPQYRLPQDLFHLGDGDIVLISSDTHNLRVLFRKQSHQNSILLTERCNHYCLMCSQPPKNVDDSYLLEETKELVKLIPSDTHEIGFTGGEPTLYGDGFIELIQLTKSYLPSTAVHILSNGRSFQDIEFSRKYAAIGHHDVMIGIPIYSDDPVLHDYIVQSKGAFNETIRGILNLKSLGQRVEVRVVIHKQNANKLVDLAEFIARNLLFVDHVALMGLEIIGFTRANMDKLWIDQIEYKDQLSEATNLLKSHGMNVSVYNHQLCLINPDIQFAYKKSISDWKNEYVDECKKCSRINDCGGFFSSAVENRYSDHLKAFL
jgi:His-Xaa-Ser system radical SAM maturase HxsC